MNRYATVGIAVVAGAALFEAALIPGVVIGGAALLAPRYLPGVRRRLWPSHGAPMRTGTKPAVDIRARSAEQAAAAAVSGQTGIEPLQAILPKLAFGRAIAKTITYRIVVTGLDFTVNYVVIGELATAAGLSTFNMVAGPLFYLGHEAIWNYFGAADGAVDLATLARQRNRETRQGDWRSFKISRTLAKTITFRTLATIMDFTTNYVVVRDVTQAVILSSSGFILGPFVYFGHEWLWDRFSSPGQSSGQLPASPKLLPAPR
jgi:uncharacterized membrane protein